MNDTKTTETPLTNEATRLIDLSRVLHDGDTTVPEAWVSPWFARDLELKLQAAQLREAELVKALKVAKELWVKLMLKADMFDYLCWLQGMHSPEQLHGVQQLCIASDSTTCWADTYADAVRVAMEHDKEIFDAMNNPAPPTNSKEMNK